MSYAAVANTPTYLGRLECEPSIAPGQVADIVAATVRALQSAQPCLVVPPQVAQWGYPPFGQGGYPGTCAAAAYDTPAIRDCKPLIGTP